MQSIVVVPKTGNTAKIEPIETVRASFFGVISCLSRFNRGIAILSLKYDGSIVPINYSYNPQVLKHDHRQFLKATAWMTDIKKQSTFLKSQTQVSTAATPISD